MYLKMIKMIEIAVMAIIYAYIYSG